MLLLIAVANAPGLLWVADGSRAADLPPWARRYT